MAEIYKQSFKQDYSDHVEMAIFNCGLEHCAPLHSWGPAVRDHYLIHLVVDGHGCYRAGGQEHHLGPGDLFLLRPGQLAGYSASEDDPWEYYWVGFAGPSAALLLAQTPFSPGHPVLHMAAGDRLRRALLDIYKARGADYPSAVRMAGYLQAALGLLMDAAPARGTDALEDYARRGASFIQQNYSRDISVETVASHVGVSRSYLHRAFRAAFGCAPGAYLTDYRLDRASQLLRHSTLSVGAVAASVGFSDPFYFSRLFRRRMGLSPSDYRLSGP